MIFSLPLQWSILAVRSSWPLAIMNHMIIQRLIIYSVFIRLKPKWERLVVKIWSLRILIKRFSHPRNILFFFFFLKKVWIVNCLHSEEKVLFGSFGSQWYVSLLSAEPTLDAHLAEKSILESKSIFLFWETPQNRKREDVHSSSPGCSLRHTCASLLLPLSFSLSLPGCRETCRESREV